MVEYLNLYYMGRDYKLYLKRRPCDKTIVVNGTRHYTRYQPKCVYNDDISKYDMRRKVEILKYKNTSNKLSKKMTYANIAKGYTAMRKTTYATQSFNNTNNNLNNLRENKFQDKYIVSLYCDTFKQTTYTRASASGVPRSANGDNILYLDRSIPLTENNDKPRITTYKGGSSEIRSLNCSSNLTFL